jgi:hypothetical protein
MGKFPAIVILALIAMVGCKGLQPNDLAGTWLIHNASRSNLPPALQEAPAKIVLNANGTFVAYEVPGLFEFEGHPMRLESGRGAWRLVSGDGGLRVRLNFQAIEDWKDGVPYGTQLVVSRNSLSYYLGDPDEGREISFERP